MTTPAFINFKGDPLTAVFSKLEWPPNGKATPSTTTPAFNPSKPLVRCFWDAIAEELAREDWKRIRKQFKTNREMAAALGAGPSDATKWLEQGRRSEAHLLRALLKFGALACPGIPDPEVVVRIGTRVFLTRIHQFLLTPPPVAKQKVAKRKVAEQKKTGQKAVERHVRRSSKDIALISLPPWWQFELLWQLLQVRDNKDKWKRFCADERSNAPDSNEDTWKVDLADLAQREPQFQALMRKVGADAYATAIRLPFFTESDLAKLEDITNPSRLHDLMKQVVTVFNKWQKAWACTTNLVGDQMEWINPARSTFPLAVLA